MDGKHRFENVEVLSQASLQDEHGFPVAQHTAYSGRAGTVIWVDHEGRDPVYLVELAGSPPPVWLRCTESDLRFTTTFAPRDRWHAVRNEVSFDTINGGPEGCLRRPGTFWECFFFDESADASVACDTSTWPSGIVGHVFPVPPGARVDRAFVLDCLRARLGMTNIVEVQGPDSLNLK